MKKTIKISLLLMLALVQNLSGNAKRFAGPDIVDGSPIDLGYEVSRPRRSVSIPSGYYLYSGNVKIIAENDITGINATVTRLDDNLQWSGIAAGNMLTFLVPTDPGTYILELTLSDGMEYYGEYTL